MDPKNTDPQTEIAAEGSVRASISSTDASAPPPVDLVPLSDLMQDRGVKRSEVCILAMLRNIAPDEDPEEIFFSREQLDDGLRTARQHVTQVANKASIFDSKKVYIIPADGILAAVICKRPTQAAVDRTMQALFSEEPQVKAGAQKQLLNDCILWPEDAQRQKLFGDYAALPHSLGIKLWARASGAQEAVSKKR